MFGNEFTSYIEPKVSVLENQNLPELAVIGRADHTVSRDRISPHALKVLYRLQSAGCRACLVGGSVRDLLLDVEPKDFDIATDAHPEEVHKLFRNCRLIGRRFRLAHVHFGPDYIEVATFRALHDAEATPADVTERDTRTNQNSHRRGQSGMILRDNVYGTIEEDAIRRDFTINALYYDIDTFAVLDYVGGITDLRNGVIRLIGDPEVRYREDPVRMIRALRFSAKLDFRIEPNTEIPIHKLGYLLENVPAARLFEETLKLFLGGQAEVGFELLSTYGLLDALLPQTADSQRRQPKFRALLKQALRDTDARIAAEKPVTPAYLYAALLWGPMLEAQQALLDEGISKPEAFEEAAEQVIRGQVKITALPKRFSAPMREIWHLQDRFYHREGKQPHRFSSHPRFRAAYDFLLLRATAGEESSQTDTSLKELADWWTQFQLDHPVTRPRPQSTKRPRRRRRNPAPGNS